MREEVFPTSSSSSKSCVFWDVKDCPITEDVSLSSISDNLKSALEKLGYYSYYWFQISAYGDKSIGSTDDAGIYYVSEGERVTKSRGVHVLLVQPHASEPQILRTPESICNCTTVLIGGKPVVDQSASRYQDFSVAITYVDGPKTGVFWDVQDSPRPNHFDPESIYQSIKSAVEGKGYFADMSIWVYADKITFSDELMDEYRKSRIYFLTDVPVDKNVRYNRMLHDILLWTMDTPVKYAAPSNVIVISNNINIQGDNFKRHGIPRIVDFMFSLTCLHSRGYNPFLVQPKHEQLTPEPSKWPGCLFNKGEVVGSFKIHPSQTKWMRKKTSKENFSVKTMNEQDFSNAYSRIYWSLDDYPIPTSIAPNCIYHNFKLALENMGYHGLFMEVHAYTGKEIPLAVDEKSLDLIKITRM